MDPVAIGVYRDISGPSAQCADFEEGNFRRKEGKLTELEARILNVHAPREAIVGSVGQPVDRSP